MKHQMPMIRLNVALLWIALAISLAGNWIQYSVYEHEIKSTIAVVKAQSNALYEELHPYGETFEPEKVDPKDGRRCGD